MNNGKKPGCLGSLLQALGFMPQPAAQAEELLEEEEPEEKEVLPYHIRDDFLSPAELNFYRVLCTAVGAWAIICPKVSLGDLFYARTGDYATNTAYRNKIDRKHVDFLVCDSRSIAPLLGLVRQRRPVVRNLVQRHPKTYRQLVPSAVSRWCCAW